MRAAEQILLTFSEGLSCTEVIRIVMEETGWSFNRFPTTTNRNYAILKIVPKFMISQVAQSQYCSLHKKP